MAYERNGPFFDWECDACGITEQTEGDDFKEAWEEAKAKGWRSHKERLLGQDEWFHKCPECVAPGAPMRVGKKGTDAS